MALVGTVTDTDASTVLAPLHLIFKYFKKTKEGGLYYMGGTYIVLFHPKWSKLCTVPLMGLKNPPLKKKI